MSVQIILWIKDSLEIHDLSNGALDLVCISIACGTPFKQGVRSKIGLSLINITLFRSSHLIHIFFKQGVQYFSKSHMGQVAENDEENL